MVSTAHSDTPSLLLTANWQPPPTLHLNSLWLLIAVRHRNLELSFLLFKVSHHFLSSELQIVDGILFLVAPSPSSTSDSIGYHTLRQRRYFP
ncbi:hypothetical protein LWI29_033634 [Acer saccharum]|uniref:Uncharacterized protein n=1 Tax=Acer saccharum TaxID=4024 RepID=A0AA39W159_ACESA|nr:hypothetical protein LWI29_033634 [Acer saccharum]